MKKTSRVTGLVAALMGATFLLMISKGKTRLRLSGSSEIIRWTSASASIRSAKRFSPRGRFRSAATFFGRYPTRLAKRIRLRAAAKVRPTEMGARVLATMEANPDLAGPILEETIRIHFS